MIRIGKYQIAFSLLFSWLMKILLLLMFIFEFYTQNFVVAAAALFALLISLLPVAISRNYKINLPWLIDFSVTLVLFLHIVGLFYDLYHNPVWWRWDILTHFLGTAVTAFLAFYIIFALDYTKKIKLTLPLMALSTWTTALAIGALWEISEYYFDLIFATQAIINLADTIHDLLFDLLGAVIVSLVGVIYVNKLRKKKQNGV